MTATFISLTVVALIAAVTPIIARAIPKQMMPETVILIVAGAILGPNFMHVIRAESEAMELLADLGCAFLFLLAGYEIDPSCVTGKDGKKGFLTWIATFVIGVAVAFIMPEIAIGKQGLIATALLFTTTALGALMPILKDRELMGTRVGDLVLAYGTWGELATVLAMAILLSTRATWQTSMILAVLFSICIWLGRLGNRAVTGGSALYAFIEEKADTNAQTMVRITILILMALVAFSSVFKLDIVLGAFAGGFVLRYIIPEENHTLEYKLNGIAYGFLVPVFFVISGCGIDLKAVIAKPLLLIWFIVSLILIRTIPIVISLSFEKNREEKLSLHNRFSVGFYCTTALPLIVAITGIAVKDGFMDSQTASVLIAAGALTVFLMPLLGELTYSFVDSEPLQAAVEIIHSPRDFNQIIQKHIEMEKESARRSRIMAKRNMTKKKHSRMNMRGKNRR